MSIAPITPPKTSRGIQESDVWAAADALLAQGLRPTIERVRQHIGRGSPNTVSPMLESWFGTLSARLGVTDNPQPENDVPEAVLQAAQAMWGSAVEQAKVAAQMLLQAREDQVAALEQAQQAEAQSLQQREEAMLQQKKSMDEAMKLARSQAQELSRRMQEMQQLLQERESSLIKLQQDAAEFQVQRELERQHHAQALQSAAAERQRLAEQFAGNERRLLAELDRSRQDIAAAKKLHTDAERKLMTKHDELHQRFVQSEEDLIAARTRQLDAEKSLQAAQARIEDLKTLLTTRNQLLELSAAAEVPVDIVARGKFAKPVMRRAVPALKSLRKNRR